jgi:hypothetical protein
MTSRLAALLLLVGGAGAMAGCVWGDGGPMGAVTVAVEARWEELPERGGTWQRLVSDFEVQVTSASAALGSLGLINTGSAALNFDPAEPPPGYSLCHGGHCHADDGRLVPYEEIAAELAGGGAPAPVLTFEVGPLELIPGGAATLDCDGPCDAPLAEIGRVDLAVAGLDIAGVVRDTLATPRITGEVPWTLHLERGADAAPISGRVDLPIDRGHDPAVVTTPTSACRWRCCRTPRCSMASASAKPPPRPTPPGRSTATRSRGSPSKLDLPRSRSTSPSRAIDRNRKEPP